MQPLATIPGTRDIAVSLLDVTGHKQAEEALRRSEKKYRTLFESSPDYMVLLGIDGKIIDINNATEKITGLPRNKLIGTHFTELKILPEEDMPLHLGKISCLLNGEYLKLMSRELLEKMVSSVGLILIQDY